MQLITSYGALEMIQHALSSLTCIAFLLACAESSRGKERSRKQLLNGWMFSCSRESLFAGDVALGMHSLASWRFAQGCGGGSEWRREMVAGMSRELS